MKSIPTVPALVVYFYRQHKDEPVHALSVELWVGQQKKAMHEPVHSLGWRETQVREYITSAIAQFNRQYEVNISAIAATVELNPSLCPLAPCPYRLENADGDAGGGSRRDHRIASNSNSIYEAI